MEKKGLSLSDIFKIFWKKRILMGIITVVTTITISLLFVLLYNPNNTTYSSQFELSFTGIANDLYPSGEKYNYKDITSKDSLVRVRNSNPDFSKINVEKLYASNNFKISKIYSERTEANPLEETSKKYVISINKSKITNKELMANYVDDLVQSFVKNVEAKATNVNYVADLRKFESYGIYTDALYFLNTERNFILDSYINLIELYGESTVVNGMSLKSHQSIAMNTINNISLNYYIAECESNRYVKNEAALDTYEEYATRRMLSLLRTKHSNDLMLKEYKELGGTVTYTEQMEKLIKENADIQIELDSLGTYVANMETNTYSILSIFSAAVVDSNFENKLIECYNSLKELMQTLEDVTKSINLDSIVLTYDSTAIIEQSAKVNVVVSVVIGLIVGLILAGIITLVVEVPRMNKKEEKNSK